MEFYKFRALIYVYPSPGFNSQRDGILLTIPMLFKLGDVWVSIPNGMEFYIGNLTRDIELRYSFNSQRDGILHEVYPKEETSCKSFNSQRDGILPDGQEVGDMGLPRFNSQRDGILQNANF